MDDACNLWLLRAQPIDLGHEVFRKLQGIERLLEGFGSVLRLATVSCEALLRCVAATLSGLRALFGASFGSGHRILHGSVWGLYGSSLPKRT